MGRKEFSVQMLTDEQGLLGRECPSCEIYFKVKIGTGLSTTQSVCPYCGYKGEGKEFYTPDQIAYVQSIIARDVIQPMFGDFANTLKWSDTQHRNSLIQLKISVSIPEFKIHQYQEKDLETNVTCDTCGLAFSIYGVFSNCPDCGKLNARVIYQKSLDASRKKLDLADVTTIDEEIRYELIKDALTGTVSAFDSLGKALSAKHTVIPAKPNNLFQNFLALDKELAALTGKSISQILTVADRDFLLLMFQVRHIYEHNAGVIDSNFVAKLPSYSNQLRRKFPLKKDDISVFIALMRKLGDAIYAEFEK